MRVIFFITLLNSFLIMQVDGQQNSLVVRMAKLKIDSLQIDSYKAALKSEIETSVRVEPGVIKLYAVAEKENPTHITIFELYADQLAYETHIKTPHFKKYKSTTKDMVRSLELVEFIPVALGGKPDK
jgi:quinol monooxygenase YgiN